jgi:dihydroxyacid dehydratase/phosphogluconate dehydratase
VIANIRPSGDTYLMEDFYYAGGLLGLMSRLTSHLDLAQINASGKTWGESLEGATVYNDDVIRPLDNAIYQEGALALLKGNLAPDGCVIKPSACEPRFLRHSGPALVFDTYEQLKANIDREDLEVTADHVLVLRNAGPKGGPGMPEWGMLPIPTKLVKQAWRQPEPRYERGYGWMFSRHIKQANEGCDFDFLETSFGRPVGEPAIN